MKYLFFFLLFPLFGNAQSKLPDDLIAEIERRVALGINQGVAVATIDTSNKIDFYNFGTENHKGSKITEHSTFEIASVTKTFTSSIIIGLAKKDRIQPDQEIRPFVPDSLPENLKKITFHQLINHISGLPRLPYDYWTSNWDDPFSDYTQTKFIDDLMTIELDTNTSWNYSNMGYALLGFVIDKLTNQQGLENFISDLNLKNTSTDKKTSTTAHNFGKPVSHWNFPEFNRYMGGVKSSSSDLIKYLHYQITFNPAFALSDFNQNIPINTNDSLISREGWLVFYRNGQEIIWHNGISGGYNSFIGYNIQTKSGIILLSNSQHSIMDLGFHYLYNKFALNKPKPSIINKIDTFIQQEKLDSIPIIWQNADTALFSKDPISIHWLECHYISTGEYKIALLLNDLLLDEFPEDWEVYFYRAKIFELMTDYDKAKTSYKKASNLFPENDFIQPLLDGLPENRPLRK